MNTVIKASERYRAHHGWLTSYHLFSFAEYYDPSNMNFGALRVFNDDYIDGEHGFGKHSHSNMEIVTVMHSGLLTHEDTMGNRAIIKEGEVQYMSAGTGVMHSEMNNGKDRVHLYQIWLEPNQQGLPPAYGQKNFSQMGKNALVPVASGATHHGALSIKSDATIYQANFEIDESTTYELQEGRGLFIYITSGTLSINDIELTVGDQARVIHEKSIMITAKENCHFIVIEVRM